MGKLTLIYASIAFVAWGLSTFFDKLTANKLGNRGIIIWIIPLTIGFLITLTLYFLAERLGFDKKGVLFLVISSFFNFAALIAYYLLFVKSGLSIAVTLTGLYPVLGVILAIIFLHEQPSTTQLVGMILAFISIFLLTR